MTVNLYSLRKDVEGNKKRNILAWVVLGLIAGAIAKAVDPQARGGGILSTILLGIVGAFVGGSLGMFFATGHLGLAAASLSIPGIAVAVLGAIVAVFIYNMFAGRTAL